jgi:hypothetical protein
VRTFVPENFAAEVAKIIAGITAVAGQGPWLKAIEPEIMTAVRQALGMMTGFEPSCIAEPAGGEPDLFGTIELQAQSGEFDLIVDLRCRRSFSVALCNILLGGESAETDNSFLMSGVGEILNVVGGRIKNSCMNRKIEVMLGLPQLLGTSPAEPDSFYRWQQNFLWQNEHWFRLGVSGTAGTSRPARKDPHADAASTPTAITPDAAAVNLKETGIHASTAAPEATVAQVDGKPASADSAPASNILAPPAAQAGAPNAESADPLFRAAP